MARVKCPRCYHVNPDGSDECEQCHTPLPRIRIEAKAPSSPAGPGNTITFHQGQLVANRYTVMNIIGRGGMGCIYKVHDRILGEEVALKTLLPQLVQDKLVVERFFNEARIARRLSHPNIVRVHDIGVAGDTIYISMEFIRGHSLRGLLEQCGPNQRLPLGRVMDVFDELCAALDYAHQHTVHRDIKPENVMIDEHGRVKLMDFGISKLMADTRMTGASVVMGTPFYMAPEQFRNSRDVDARADIYSVGVMLYEILTGVIPTGVPKPASEMRSGMPPGLDAVVLKCVEADPGKRYGSAAELREALAPLRAMVASGTMPKPSRPARSGSRAPLKRIAGGLLALAVLLLAGAGAFYSDTLIPAPVTEATAMPLPPASNLEDSASYDAYAALEPKLRSAAEGRAGAAMAVVLTEANALWTRAQAASSDGQAAEALALARSAFAHYMAAVLQPGGMVFIPPGDTIVDGNRVAVDGFLIDETEVSVQAFRNFAQRIEGGWPIPEAMADFPGEYPMTYVTYYDAQAFAAEQGKQLPTVPQWARAAYAVEPRAYPWGNEWQEGACACLNSEAEAGMPAAIGSFVEDESAFKVKDMAGSVSEWTCTPATAIEAGTQPDFGTLMLVRGGNYNAAAWPLTDSFTWPYEGRTPIIGFRCVKAIPDTPRAVEQALTLESVAR